MVTAVRCALFILICTAAVSLPFVLVQYCRKKRELEQKIQQQKQNFDGKLEAMEASANELTLAYHSLRTLQELTEQAVTQGDVHASFVAFDTASGKQLMGNQADQKLREALNCAPDESLDDCLRTRCACGPAVFAVQKDHISGWAQVVMCQSEQTRLYAITDVTAAVNLRNKEAYEQRYDKLTGTYNQATFIENARGLFAEKEQLGVSCAFVLRMEYIGEHSVGISQEKLEEYTKACADSLKKHSGSGIFSRHASGEFYGILYGYPDRPSAEDVLHQILSEINAASRLLELLNESAAKVNLGVAWYPDDSESVDELISYASFCVYIAKKNESHGLEVFDRKVFQRDGYLLHGRAGFAEMVEKKMVRFALQPIVDVATAKIYGYELLMRPQHKDMRSMGDVINLAIVQGRTHAIETLTWFEGMKAFSELVEAGKIRYDAKVFINSIGGTGLTEKEHLDFSEKYYDYLKNIVIEITESQQESEEYTAVKRRRAAEWGAQIAIDDYGTGYNSEMSLLFFQPSIVKVDMAFVRGIDRNADKQMLFQNLVSYARKREISVLAEGVETAEEMKTVIEFGADYIQGYYLAMPEFLPKELSEKHMEEIGGMRYGSKRR